MNSKISRVAIVGAGLSGRLVALNLLRCANADTVVQIRMFDRGDEYYMGPAYSDEADHLLLNVPAVRMGALPEDPAHFLKWVRDQGMPVGEWDFLPRKLYRRYVLGLMDNALRVRPSGVTFDHIREEVIDIEVKERKATIYTAGGDSFTAEKVVLALGNFPPPHPLVSNPLVLESERYIRDPWKSDVLDRLASHDSVFLVGTGQTMVDLVLGLQQKRHGGRITAISRRGLLPMAHGSFEPYPSFLEEIKLADNLPGMCRVVHRHLGQAKAMGIDQRTVIDSLRPATQEIWLNLSEGDKRRFVRHLFRRWEIIRSRIPPQSQVIIERLRASGQLEAISGKIVDLVDAGTTMEVHYVPRSEADIRVETAALVINCIGPETDYRRIDHPLVRHLMGRGLIRCGPARLGLDALPNGAIIGQPGEASRVLYTLGFTMRGVLWEVLAAPEIRVQAEQLARLLLEDLRGYSSMAKSKP